MKAKPHLLTCLRRCALAVAAAVAVSSLAGTARAASEDWVNLVSDIPGVTHITDPHLVNPWGIASGPDGSLWVADNGTGRVTIYAGSGTPLPPAHPIALIVPAPITSGSNPSTPTGLVLNHGAFAQSGSNDFLISSGSNSGPSIYLVATEDGTIAGYNPLVSGSSFITKVDNSALQAVYKGIALSTGSNGAHRLYAANFHSGQIDVFNNQFQVTLTPGGFTDPSPVAGFAPFNIKQVAIRKGNKVQRFLFVSYAKQDNAVNAHEDVPGAGNGYINVFDPDGNFINRFVNFTTNPGNELNSPWGMAVSHVRHGRIPPALFVGNFGDGKIYAFQLDDISGQHAGTSLGALKTQRGDELQFGGLWGLEFGRPRQTLTQFLADPDELGGGINSLYFAAGIADENDGLFGRILFR